MTGKESTLLEFFYGTEPIIIPVYQRNYTWGTPDCKQLLDDIFAISDDSKKTHFIGSVVHVKHSDGNIIIDGQQRITTLSILLLAIRNAVRDGKLTEDNPMLTKEIEFSFLINQFSSNEERRMKLKPFRDDCRAFDALFGEESGLIHESKITENYLYFYNRLVESNINPRDILNAIKRLVFVRITLEPEHGDNAQQIFESINSTGVRLSESDKIRNFVLMGLDAATQEKYYNNYWLPIEQNTNLGMEDFVRDYLTIFCKAIPKKNEVYFKFKQYANDTYSFSIQPLLESLKHYSELYSKIKTCKVGCKEANALMENLAQLDIQTIYPFLLSYFDYCYSTSVEDKEMVKVLQTIDVFLFRRIMGGYYNTGLNKIFYNLHQRVLKMQHSDWKYSDVLIYLLKNGISYWVFPDDDAFINSFEEREVYKMRANYRLYFFTRLEESLNKEAVGVQNKIESGVLSIEHIMPQTLTPDWEKELGPDFTEEDFKKWIHNIGNLTLTAYNSEYSNRKFSEKRDGVPSLPDMKGFKDSCVAMNKQVSECEHWTLKEIKERCASIANQSVSIWPYPTTDFKPLVIEDEFIPIDAEYKFKGRYIKSYTFNGITTNVDSWADAFTRIVKSLYEKDSAILHQFANDDKDLFYAKQEASGFNKIADGIYLYVACNTDRKLNQMQRLLTAYGYESDDICVALHPAANIPESEESSFRTDFWQGFNDAAAIHPTFAKEFSLRKPQDASWMDLSLFCNTYWISLTINTQRKHLSAGIYIGDDFNMYEYFKSKKTEIESYIGADVEFTKATKASRFRSFMRDFDVTNRTLWPEAYKWFIEMALKYKQVHIMLGKK